MLLKSLLNKSVALLRKNEVPEPEADAQVFLSYVLSCSRTDLFCRLNDSIDDKTCDKITQQYDYLIQQRINRVPLWYLTGKKEFMGIEFKVAPGVFIPRPETEILVEETMEVIHCHEVKSQKLKVKNLLFVVDVGTGCGNIAVSLAKLLPGRIKKVYATDIDSKCIELARKNALRIGVENIEFFVGDLFEPLTEKNLNIVVSNPPYVASGEYNKLLPEIFHEPKEALLGGDEGLNFYFRIARESKIFLSSGGMVIVEIGYNQSEKVREIFEKENFIIKKVVKDYSNFERVIVAQWIK